LEKGAPEMYLKNNFGQKNGWENIASTDDLLEPEYLKELLEKLMGE
jgi:hypothetical protein